MDSEGIRILHVLDKIADNSGLSCVVMNYYAKLAHDRFTFDFMLNEDVDAETRAYIEGNGSKIFVMPELKVVNIFRYIKELSLFYKKHDYKIIHGHVANSAVFYLGIARNVPLKIIHSQNAGGSVILTKRIRNWILTRFIKIVANRYVACSKEAAEFLFGKKNNATILSNAIEVEEFSFKPEKRETIRNALDLENALIIGHVGRFCVEKNHSFLIDVFSQINEKYTNAVLMLIGDGELFDNIQRKAVANAAHDNILFMGKVDNISDYLSAMDVFVLPSLSEGLPLVVVEAQASGLPVLASDRVTREVDVTGMVTFLPLEVRRWVEILRNFKKHTNAERVSTAFILKESRFDVEKQTGILCAYYDNLLSEMKVR